MDELNRDLFLMINATPQSGDEWIALAHFFAEWLIFIVPIVTVGLWLWQSSQRKFLLDVTITVVIAVSVTALIRENMYHARPFVEGLGHQLLAHRPTSSFPSNHGTLIFTFAFAFLCGRRVLYGTGLLMVAFLIAWSRIYLGVHWPLDMAGAILVAVLACVITQLISPRWRNVFLQKIEQAYRLLFSVFIRKGWVSP